MDAQLHGKNFPSFNYYRESGMAGHALPHLTKMTQSI